MANEIQLSSTFVYSKTGKETITTGTVGVTVTNSRYIKKIAGISTNAQTLDYGSVTVPGFIGAHNLGANDIQLGTGSTYLITLKPGDPWSFFRATGLTVYAKASTTTTDLEYFFADE